MADKNIRQEEEECRKFLGISGDDLNVKNEIKKCYDYISTNYLEKKFSEILGSLQINPDEKNAVKKQLPNNVKEIIENLNSSHQCLTTSMNINDFIKVKKVKDTQFRSEIIKGFAMTKGAFTKIKGLSRENTKILILDFDLNEHEIKDPFEKDNEKQKKKNKEEKDKKDDNIKNESSWADDILEKIESLNVNVILINKGIDNRLLEKMEKSKIIAINIKSRSLQNIAKCIKCKALSSLEEFEQYIKNKDNKEDDKNKKLNICGSCFYEIVDIKKFSEEKTQSVICYNSIKDYKPDIFEKIIYRPKFKLMKFISKNNDYFRTLLLRSSSKVLLDNIKKALKEEIFITVRDFFLQQKILHFLFCKVEFILPKKEEESEQEQEKGNINNINIKTNNNNNDIRIKTKNNTTVNQVGTIKRMIELQNEKAKLKENKDSNKLNKKNTSQPAKVNNMAPITIINDEPNSPTSPQFSLKKKQLSTGQKSISAQDPSNKKQDFNISKDTNIFPEIIEENIPFKSKSSAIVKESGLNNNDNSKNSKNNINEETVNDEISNFSLETYNDYKIKNLISDNIFKIEKQEENKFVEQEESNNYQFGFDISIIRKNEGNKTNLKLLKLKMCKGDKNYNQQKTDKAINNTLNRDITLKIKSENELLKKLNFICGNPENIELIFYDATSREQNDKQFGKFIIGMLADQYKECNNCHNDMSKHFYYLYNSNYSRIKISYITKEDSNLKLIIDNIHSKDKNFRLIRKEMINEEEIDYNIDIFSYGYCKICKKIVTPLIKMPKDFFSYSTAEFFKHLLNNTKIYNRNKIEFNLINAYKKSPKNNYFTKECEHSSFRDINRFFVSIYGCLKFEIETLEKYEILSVQQIPDNGEINTNERKTTSTLEITENKGNNQDKFNDLFKISDFIGNIIKNEKEEVEKLFSKRNENYIKFCENSLINLLNEIINYILIDSNKDPSTNTRNGEYPIEINSPLLSKVSKACSNDNKEVPMNFKEYFTNKNFQNIKGVKEIGLRKKIAFRIAQFKVLYNKIRLYIYKLKLYIALMDALRKKENNNEEDKSKQEKENLKEDIKNANETDGDYDKLKSAYDENMNIEKAKFNSKSKSQALKANPKFEISNSMNIEIIIKQLIENFISLDDTNHSTNKYSDIFENYSEYKTMLDTIIFYEDKQNDFSSIIKKDDLSSIVAFGISSLLYKNFLRDKTTLLGIQKNESDISNNNSTLSIQIDRGKDNEINLEQKLYDSLFILEKTDTKLESEILSGETKSLAIEIKSINQEQLYPNDTSERKVSYNRPTKGTKGISYASPNPYAQNIKGVQEMEEIDKKLEKIEDKIASFFNTIERLKNDLIERVKTEIKIIKSTNDCYIALKNIKVEYSLNNNSQGYKDNNSILDEEQKKDLANNEKKKEIVDNFISSAEEQMKIKQNPFSQKTMKNLQNTENLSNKKEDKDEHLNLNLIEFIGNLFFYEDKIPKSEIELTIYFPIQFEALRIACCSTYEDLVESIMNSTIWKNVSGGKSKAKFYKTKDEKYLFKSIKENEFNMFLEMAINYFHHMDEYLFHKMPSLLMKILGVYKIIIKKDEKGTNNKETYYLMMMENLNYGLNFDNGNIISYDLKGSVINRYVNKSNINEKTNVVLYDNNFKENFNNEPIPLNKKIYDLLLISVHNDTLFLNNMGVVDYSLLLHIYSNKEKKINYIRMGIIDYIRKYTWDKQLEHYIKIFINRFVVPTIINPSAYKNRFEEAIKDYFICIYDDLDENQNFKL